MQLSQAQQEFRESLLQEASQLVQGLRQDKNILAAILTGSAAWGKPNPDGDLDILLITQGKSGAFYRYMMPTFCPVVRRTELGYIPSEVVTRNIKNSYGTRLGSEMLEQLKHGRVLFQRGSAGDDIIKSCRRAAPGPKVIGKSLHKMRKELDDLQHQEQSGTSMGMVLGARRVAKHALRILLLAREQTAVSKEKHEYRAAKKHLHGHEMAQYAELLGLEHLTKEDAQITVDRAKRILAWVLERHSLAADLVA